MKVPFPIVYYWTFSDCLFCGGGGGGGEGGRVYGLKVLLNSIGWTAFLKGFVNFKKQCSGVNKKSMTTERNNKSSCAK